MDERDDDEGAGADREAILARRQRFVAATLAGLTTSALATACPCLKVAPAPGAAGEPGDAAMDAEAAEVEADDEQDDGDSVEEASPADGEIPDAAEGEAEPEG